MWQQRQRAGDLLQIAARFPDFPILAETYRECLVDAFDLEALRRLLAGIRSRQIRVVAVDSERASPFAASLLFDYVGNYLYEGDAPLAERRAQALTLDRDLLEELMGTEELRELLDPVAELELELQGLLQRWPRDADEAHDLMARSATCPRRSSPPGRHRRWPPGGCGTSGASSRSVSPARAAGSWPRTRGGTATPSAWPPTGLPEAFLEPVDDALRELVARYARTHGPFTAAELHERYGVDASAVLSARARAPREILVRAELRPGGDGSRVVRGGGAARSAARLARGPAQGDRLPTGERLAAFLPSWQGIDRHL